MNKFISKVFNSIWMIPFLCIVSVIIYISYLIDDNSSGINITKEKRKDNLK